MIRRAFVLGAGLGNRLRPLTSQLPKPLIPVHHRPLISYAFEHLAHAGISEFIVNTHHLPSQYAIAFPDGRTSGCPITFRHEPILLETGGGVANVADLLADQPFIVYNGDILTDLPLAPALAHHIASGNLVTLILQTHGAVRNVAHDPVTGAILDLRNARQTNHPTQYQFSGIWIAQPAFMAYLPPRGTIESVVAAWLRAIAAGEKIGGHIEDRGLWFDLGDRASYLRAHHHTRQQPFPAHAPLTPQELEPAHPGAEIDITAQIDDHSSIATGASVAAGAILRRTIVWPGAAVLDGAILEDCIVLRGATATGHHCQKDIE